MKQFFFFVLSFFLPVTGISQYHYLVKGKAPDLFNNVKLYLKISDDYSQAPYTILDSATVMNNAFSFSGNLHKVCEIATIYYFEPGTHKQFLKRLVIDSGKVSLTIQPVPSDYVYYTNKLSILDVKNSVSNQILTRLDSLYNAYYETYGVYTDDTKRFRVLNLDKELESTNKQREMLKQYDSYFNLVYLYSLSHFAGQKPDSILSSFDFLSDNLKSLPLGRELHQRLTDAILGTTLLRPDKQMPYFNVNAYDGSLFNNKSLKDIPYLIVFSATWCIPCKQDLPTIVKFYNKYKASGLKVVYFNFDDNHKKWQQEIQKYKLKWINVSEGVKMSKSKIAMDFNLNHVPVYLLVNKKGEIIYNSDYNKGNNRLISLDNYIKEIIN